MDTSKIINGTYGEAWCDSEYLSATYGLQAKIALNKETVNVCGKLMVGKKVLSAEGTGSLKLYKTDSSAAKRMQSVMSGKMPSCTIITKLADPDSYGSERIMLIGVVFDEILLADWEAATLGKVELPFTFSDYEFLDEIAGE